MSHRQLNVCFLINQLAPGGAPTLLLDIVRHTDPEANIEYTVCFIEGEDELAPDFEAAGARVVDFGAEFKFDPRAMWRMFRFFQREDFDVLHAHLPYSQTLGRVFGRLGGTETIVSTQHNFADNYHPVTRVLERLTRPLDTATVAVSRSVERDFTGESHRYPDHGGKWCTIYNGVDVEGFAERVEQADGEAIRQQWNLDEDPVFLNIGRYTQSKNQKSLIQSMRIVLDECPTAKLLLVGWGPLENELQKMVSDLGMDGSIQITGRSRNVEQYYAAADIFALSSSSESFGIVLVEAMSAGLPVVATDIPGPNEIVVDGETGLLVSSNSPSELADAMIRVLNTQHTFRAQGYDRATDGFSIKITTNKYISLYNSCLTRAS